MKLGKYTKYRGKPAVSFDRTFHCPIERVWSAVTEPDELVRWFPSGVTHEARAGGAIAFSGDPYSDPDTGTILDFKPMTSFGFTWGADEVHLELTDLQGRCHFTLVNVLEATDTAARNAAGWTICLAELDKLLAGEASDGPHSDEAGAGFESILHTYVAAGMPSGAAIPDKRD